MTKRWRSPPDSGSRRASGNGDSELWDCPPYSTSRNPLQRGQDRRKAEAQARKREPRVPGVHNYLKPLLEATAEAMETGLMERGQVTITNVRHDKWCDVYSGGVCNCDPEIEFQPLVRAGEIN